MLCQLIAITACLVHCSSSPRSSFDAKARAVLVSAIVCSVDIVTHRSSSLLFSAVVLSDSAVLKRLETRTTSRSAVHYAHEAVALVLANTRPFD